MAPSARPAFARRSLTWLVLVVGVAASVVTWLYATRSQTERIRAGFLSRAQTQVAVASQQLRNYREMVYSLRDTFLGQQEVTRDEFKHVADALLQRHAGVQALEWVQIVPEAGRAALEQKATSELGRPFVIRRRAADGSLQPSPPAAEYIVIAYAAPVAGNETVLGYDLLSSPTLPLMTAARTSREFRVTHSFPLIQSTGPEMEPGIIFILPFSRPEPGSPVEGFVQGVFHVQTMLAQSHRLMTNEALETYYLDVTEPGSPTLLYANLAGNEPLRHPGATPKLPPLNHPADLHETLELGGRRWLMVVRQNPDWTARTSSRQPDLILLAGLTITALLALIIHSLVRRAARIEQEVQERTRELRASEARLQDIVDHSPAIIFLKDREGRHLMCNEPFARSCRRPHAEIIGKTDVELFGREMAEDFRRSDETVLRTGLPVQFEQAVDTPSGLVSCLVQKFPLLDENGRAYALCGIATDISDRKTAEEHRLKLERKLLEAQKLESLGVLAGGVAHDFNNILTAILGNATLASMELPATHKATFQLQQIERAANRAADLCAQMLAYAGRASFVTAPVNLSKLVRDTSALLDASIGRRVRVELEVDDTVPAAMADATQVRQIVMNLVINAADAMGDRTDGQVIVRTLARELTAEFLQRAVQSPARPAGMYVGLEVADNGSGMKPEVVARIFEPFFSTKFSGRGLGLAAVLGIVQSHDGALFVESIPGGGTTFRIFLPATQARAADTTPPMGIPAAPLRGTVLVVDDEEPVRKVAEGALASQGIAVILASDGQAAIDLLRTTNGTIDLVLLDLTMPGLAGDETLRRLREIRPDLRAVIMSGYSEAETRQRCASLGVSDYLPKPFDVTTLLAKLRPHLS